MLSDVPIGYEWAGYSTKDSFIFDDLFSNQFSKGTVRCGDARNNFIRECPLVFFCIKPECHDDLSAIVRG